MWSTCRWCWASRRARDRDGDRRCPVRAVPSRPRLRPGRGGDGPVPDRYHTVRGSAVHLEVPTIWMVPERVDDRIVVGINERFVLLAGERASASAAWDRAKRYRRRIRNEERRQGTCRSESAPTRPPWASGGMLVEESGAALPG